MPWEGAAVVEAPCPMTAAPSHKEAQAGFQLAVTAVQVELSLLCMEEVYESAIR